MNDPCSIALSFDSILLDLHQSDPMIRYEVRYQTPYNQCEWRSQWFKTYEEAMSMVEFYLSCGSKSYLV